MTQTHRTAKSRAWHAGRLFALHQLRDVEVLGPQHRGQIQVSGTTLHGTTEELEALAHQLLAVIKRAESVGTV